MSLRAYTANTLLLRDDVGRAKPSHYNLPGEDFVYGKKLMADKEGCKAVSMTWKFHDFSDKAKAPRDFKALNKQVVKEGFTTSKLIHITLPDSEFRYGIRNRPATPMKNVIGNYYGIEAEIIALHQHHEEIEYERNRIKNLMRGNKSAQLNAEKTKEKIEELRQGPKKDLFKLSRFTSKASSKVKETIAKNKADLESRIMQNSQIQATARNEEFEENQGMEESQ